MAKKPSLESTDVTAILQQLNDAGQQTGKVSNSLQILTKAMKHLQDQLKEELKEEEKIEQETAPALHGWFIGDVDQDDNLMRGTFHEERPEPDMKGAEYAFAGWDDDQIDSAVPRVLMSRLQYDEWKQMVEDHRDEIVKLTKFRDEYKGLLQKQGELTLAWKQLADKNQENLKLAIVEKEALKAQVTSLQWEVESMKEKNSW